MLRARAADRSRTTRATTGTTNARPTRAAAGDRKTISARAPMLRTRCLPRAPALSGCAGLRPPGASCRACRTRRRPASSAGSRPQEHLEIELGGGVRRIAAGGALERGERELELLLALLPGARRPVGEHDAEHDVDARPIGRTERGAQPREPLDDLEPRACLRIRRSRDHIGEPGPVVLVGAQHLAARPDPEQRLSCPHRRARA